LREGTAVEDFLAPAQIVIGARGAEVAARVASLFRGVEGPLSLTSIEAAEMAKCASNIWHGLKIAFANEIGSYCRSHAIDPAEVMQIFMQDRKLNLSDQYLQPGFAFGGPCLVKDIEAFMNSARQRDLALPVIASILPSNRRRIEDRADLILRTGKRAIGFLGLGYKPDTDDMRSSPYLDLCCRLIGHGCDLRIFDPFLSRSALSGDIAEELSAAGVPARARIVDSLDEALMHGDLIVVGTPHQAFADIRRRLTSGQSLIDLACGALETAGADIEIGS
jgi:GDP-mannose 6-dehydrogenase